MRLSKGDSSLPGEVLAGKVKADLARAYQKIVEQNWELSSDVQKELRKRIEILRGS